MTNLLAVKKYRNTRKGLASKIYNSQISNSKKRGHNPPEYTFVEFRSWLFAQENFEKLFICWEKSGYNKLLVPSCDRIDENKGYSFSNIILTTWRNNYLSFSYKKKFGFTDKNTISVEQIDKNNSVVNYFFSIAEASRKTGINNGSISYSCSGKREYAGGYKWKIKTV